MGGIWFGYTNNSCLGMVAMTWKIEAFRYKTYFLLRISILETYKIQYSECISLKCGTDSATFKAEKGTFYIGYAAMNSEFLMNVLTQYKVKNFYSFGSRLSCDCGRKRILIGTKADLVVDGLYINSKKPYVPLKGIELWQAKSLEMDHNVFGLKDTVE